jgi:hypothetical protein
MGDLFTSRFSSLSGAGLFNTMRRYCPEEPLSSGLFFCAADFDEFQENVWNFHLEKLG